MHIVWECKDWERVIYEDEKVERELIKREKLSVSFPYIFIIILTVIVYTKSLKNKV